MRGTDLERTVAGSVNGPLIMSDERLRRMDEQGIDVEVLSINPYWYGVDRQLATRLIATQNEGLAALCRPRAGGEARFAPLATVALQHPELAAEQLGTLVFIHPQGAPQLARRLEGNGFLTNVIGNPLDTTIALSHLIFEGTLDRYPGLKICGAHGGGFLPSYNGRFDQGCVAFPANCKGSLKRKPSEYLKQMYFDLMVFNAEGLRHLVAEYGADHVALGTDYPFPWTTTAVDHVLATPGLSDQDRAAILRSKRRAIVGNRRVKALAAHVPCGLAAR